jgi:uncharacterized protein YndB with AHSA1/START domain
MTYDLRIERHLDAPPELVFDTIVDPAAQADLFSGVVEGWGLRSFEIDLRVGGTWEFRFEGHDAGTLLVIEERGFETVEVRDSFLSGTPSWVDAVERVVMDRARTGSTRP